MKEGMPKSVVTRPFTSPTEAAKPSAMASASHSFMSLVTNRIAQTIGVKAKFWPTERSNSPEIISIVTPTATMPMVEATVLIAVIVCGDQKFGVCSVKKSTTARRPRAGASSRTFRQRLDERSALTLPGQGRRRRDRSARRSVHELCVADRCQELERPGSGRRGETARAGDIGQQRPASMQACTVSILSLVTIDVPVSTFAGRGCISPDSRGWRPRSSSAGTAAG